MAALVYSHSAARVVLLKCNSGHVTLCLQSSRVKARVFTVVEKLYNLVPITFLTSFPIILSTTIPVPATLISLPFHEYTRQAFPSRPLNSTRSDFLKSLHSSLPHLPPMPTQMSPSQWDIIRALHLRYLYLSPILSVPFPTLLFSITLIS